MKLRYTIVWFEDSPEFIDSLRPDVEEYLQEMGFSANIISKSTSEGSIEVVKEQDPDLILVDFNLGQGTKGDDIVQKIRENEFYVDVIFYAKAEGFREDVGKLDGVFYTDREKLREKIPKIIDITVKRQQDVNNLRGVLIAEIIDLERKMESFIAEYICSQNKTRQSVFERLYDYNHEHGTLTTMHKFRLTNSIFKKAIEKMSNDCAEAANHGKNVQPFRDEMESVQAKKKKFNEVQNLIEIRDIMAHWEECKDPKNTLLCRDKDGKQIHVNEGYCRKTRKELKAQSENFDSLVNEVKKVFEMSP